MDAYIEGVRVAETPSGLAAVVTLGVEVDRGGDGDGDAEAENVVDRNDGNDEDVLPIFVGIEEATSIARGLDAADIGRPLTHDLLLDIVEELGGRIDRIVVADLEDGTYIADLHIVTPRSSAVVDARPSDSLALAARTNADIEIEPSVFEAGREPRSEYEALSDIRELIP